MKGPSAEKRAAAEKLFRDGQRAAEELGKLLLDAKAWNTLAVALRRFAVLMEVRWRMSEDDPGRFARDDAHQVVRMLRVRTRKFLHLLESFADDGEELEDTRVQGLVRRGAEIANLVAVLAQVHGVWSVDARLPKP